MSKILGILDLLGLRGFNAGPPGKLVRHVDARYDVNALIRDGWFEAYQAFQRKGIFDKCEQIVSFIADGPTRARFLGVYRILGTPRLSSEGILPKGCPYQEWLAPGDYFYTLHRQPGYEDLKWRVIIDWGKGAKAFAQRLTNKEVVAILPKGQRVPVFQDYLEFTLSYDELREMCMNPEAYQEWRARLSAVAGVYLIVASKKGEQYVGSAYGEEGIWGRWMAYARSGDGGNAMLRKLIDQDHDYPRRFIFSILQVLPKSQTRDEVVRWESRYKAKLGTRATGLNLPQS